MSKWKEVSLSELGKTITGKTPSSQYPEDFGDEVPFITPSDSFENKYISKPERYLSRSGSDRLKDKIISSDSIMVTCIGSAMGKVAKNSLPSVTNQQINSIIVNENFDSDYIYYLFKNNYAVFRNAASGSTAIPILNKTDFDNLKFKVELDLNQQRKMVSILSKIDDKIEINNQINQELEAMAKTLYDYWFVQFDFPDQNGKPYKSSGGKMVYNPELKREIPEGWGVEKLGELAQFKNGINYEKTSSGSEKVKIINVRNISSSTIFINQTDLDEIFLENDKSTNFIVNEGMILITRSGIPGATRLVSELEAKTVYSGFIIASEVNDLIYKNLIFYYLKNVEEVLKNQSAGTIMKNISQSVLTDMVVSRPPQNLLLKFNSIIDNLLEQMKNVQRQNQQLTQLRDWLLPMLMNGQVRVE
ncbi:restriction endonuclease subunit S [Streptococcus oralis]|uniref:Type I restriction endonuclease n=1 Tax=Streptococcus oralis subsp. dentisani TaxID=1458253 RepID=A0A1X1J2J0_STROR|nr:restriction endonuclease subunit S [Streptococcus oralis]ORO79601.1 type I restriction endonuclease [Streptococcus oralis subsp. dentisani]